MNKGEVLLEHVTLSWMGGDEGRLPVLDDLALHIKAREFVCILGPSGCGKTTLLHLIAGFQRPSSGRIVVSGKEVLGPGPERAMVFQHSALFPWFTVAGNIGYGLRHGDRGRIKELLRLVGLDEFADVHPHQLSGGMRQKVSLARALALEPDVLLMDEPFAAIDTFNRERLQDELLRIREAMGCTIVFVTHNIQEAVYLSDRTIVLSQRPAKITLEQEVDLSFPRSRTDRALWEISQKLYARCGCCTENANNDPQLQLEKRKVE
ncbi:MAG: ABC-type nitrate/sulfonate/bicarbonate transport system ATPase [Desulfobulbaceae bacterium]|nr:MAG: ABC-type nitrate/sulfonate/bicarbonate transport system ATPase [Desulfobulbaceae bacterium]